MKLEQEQHFDELLKSAAKAENAALPFDSWKAEILEKAAQAPAHPQGLLEFASPQKEERPRPLYRKLAPYACAAAALVVLVVGMKMLNIGWGANSAAPAAMEAPAQAPAAAAYSFESSAEEEIGQEESAVARDAALPEAAMEEPAAADVIDQTPMESSSPQTDCVTSSNSNGAVSGAGGEEKADIDSGAAGGSLGDMPYGEGPLLGMAAPENACGQQALEAVLAALEMEQEQAVQPQMTLEEDASVAVQPLKGGTVAVITGDLYRVTLNAADPDSTAYYVDADTFEVYGSAVG